VEIKKKIAKALSQSLKDAYVRLEDDDGISGFVVSPHFKGMTSLDRQKLIDDILDHAPDPLSKEERRRVLMIAALTPVEHDAVGARIRVRVHRVREKAGGAVEVLLHGGLSDAEYIRGAFKNQKGVRTTEPKPVPRAPGILISFQAKGTAADPLTKEKALRVLKDDPYIEVMPSP
jgi:acid stress-induced BolA-like protein IbaG/YrbA